MHIEDTITLRCKYCGAPLEKPENNSEYIKCGSCGTTQKSIDAKAFLDQIMGQIYSWVKNSIPSGFDLSNAANIDSLARHAIFTHNIRPSLESDYSHYQFNAQRLLMQPLLILPFMTNQDIGSDHNPVELFEFNAKVKSIKQLAIESENHHLVDVMDTISSSFAYLLNNIRLIQEDIEERFELMSLNFSIASVNILDNSELVPVFHRLSGLSQINRGIHLLLNGDTKPAKKAVKEGIESLQRSTEMISSDTSFRFMDHAVRQELRIARIIEKMVYCSDKDPSGFPLNTVVIFEYLINELIRQEQFESGEWKGSFTNLKRYEEIFNWITKIRITQTKEVRVTSVNGPGSYLFPFWVIHLTYSFTTGVFWTKKGKEAKEVLLISSNFPTDPILLSTNPSSAITNVFKRRLSAGFLDDTLRSMFGREISISCGDQTIRRVIQSASGRSVGNKRFIPPLSSKKQAEIFVNRYISETLQKNTVIREKMRLSAPKVAGLVFIPGDMTYSSFKLGLDLGELTPKSIGDLKVLNKMAL